MYFYVQVLINIYFCCLCSENATNIFDFKRAARRNQPWKRFAHFCTFGAESSPGRTFCALQFTRPGESRGLIFCGSFPLILDLNYKQHFFHFISWLNIEFVACELCSSLWVCFKFLVFWVAFPINCQSSMKFPSIASSSMDQVKIYLRLVDSLKVQPLILVSML